MSGAVPPPAARPLEVITLLLTNEVVVLLTIVPRWKNEVTVALTIRKTGMTPPILVPGSLNTKRTLTAVTGASE